MIDGSVKKNTNKQNFYISILSVINNNLGECIIDNNE